MPEVTNTTACQNGFFDGWKNWCIKHAVNCVQNITIGDFPPMILQAHEQYLAGAKAANNSGISGCPFGENTAYCSGWNSNNGPDYGNWDCDFDKYNYTGPFSSNLVGCPLDVLKPSQMAKPHVLVGTWNYVNESKESKTMPMISLKISGKITYSDYGNFTLIVPNHSAFGDYTLEGSWGYQGHNIITQCYIGGCENSTLIVVSLNHVEMKDNRNDIIHLMR